MRWLLLFLWNPIAALDLSDREDNRPNHAKVIPAITLFWLMVLASIGLLPTTEQCIVLLSAAFGYSGWRTFLSWRKPSQQGLRTHVPMHESQSWMDHSPLPMMGPSEPAP